jgi:Domain of unknown function (DUF4350)
MTTVSSPPTARSGRQLSGRLWIWIGLGIAALVFLIFLGAPPSKSGSTYERSPTGYSNWYLAMQQQGVEIGRWQKNYDQLSGSGQTLLQIQGSEDQQPDSSLWVEPDIQDWVRQGNTLIRLSWNGKVTQHPFSTRLSSPVGEVWIETTRRQISLEPRQESILADKAGNVFWSERLPGGELVWGTYPFLAANAYPKNSPNYQFLTRLAQNRGGKIWVDEWMHGYRDRLTSAEKKVKRPYQDVFDYLLRTPVFSLAVQTGLIILFLLWQGNQRFGPLQIPTPPDLGNSERYIQSLAGVLNNCRHTDFVLDRLVVQFRQQLATKLGISLQQRGEITAGYDQQLSDAWASQSGGSPQQVMGLFQQINSKHRLNDQELLTWLGTVESILRGIP